MININNYIDSEGKIKAWPSKAEAKLRVLEHLVKSFDYGVIYTEKQVNRIITEMHTFNDYFLLRRELIVNALMFRERDCSRYWRGDMADCCRKVETDRLYITNTEASSVEALKEIYNSCGYISDWTGIKHLPEYIDTIISEGDLPPDGHKEFYKVKTICEKATSREIALLEYYLGYPDKKALWISSLFIHPDYQNKGYGKELVQYICQAAAAAGLEKIGLGVHLKNWPALNFWTKNGFDKITGLHGDKLCSADTFCCMGLEKVIV